MRPNVRALLRLRSIAITIRYANELNGDPSEYNMKYNRFN